MQYKQDFSQPTLDDHFDKTILPKVMQVSPPATSDISAFHACSTPRFALFVAHVAFLPQLELAG